jgi:hypothetical protein
MLSLLKRKGRRRTLRDAAPKERIAENIGPYMIVKVRGLMGMVFEVTTDPGNAEARRGTFGTQHEAHELVRVLRQATLAAAAA